MYQEKTSTCEVKLNTKHLEFIDNTNIETSKPKARLYATDRT